jgi:hypothetical protein
MKIRYIETQPINQTLEFETRGLFNEFYAKRIKEIIDYTYPKNLNFYEYYKCKIVRLKKNGEPRKEYNPTHLRTKKSKEKQKKKFAEYCEKRKKATIEKNYLKEKAKIEFQIQYWQRKLDELNLENNIGK